MEKLSGALKIVAGTMLAFVMFVLAGGRLIADLIGYTTTPEDLSALRAKAPVIVQWFLGLPSWVAVGIAIGLAGFSAYLVVSGVKRLVAEQKLELTLPEGTITSDQAKRLLDWLEWFRNDWEAQKDVLPTINAGLAESNAQTAGVEQRMRALEQSVPGMVQLHLSGLSEQIANQIAGQHNNNEFLLLDVRKELRRLGDELELLRVQSDGQQETA